jgi:hypothetical protein
MDFAEGNTPRSWSRQGKSRVTIPPIPSISKETAVANILISGASQGNRVAAVKAALQKSPARVAPHHGGREGNALRRGHAGRVSVAHELYEKERDEAHTPHRRHSKRLGAVQVPTPRSVGRRTLTLARRSLRSTRPVRRSKGPTQAHWGQQRRDDDHQDERREHGLRQQGLPVERERGPDAREDEPMV